MNMSHSHTYTEMTVAGCRVCTVPRFWFSRRWRLAVLCCIALLIITSQRVSINVAVKPMLNNTSSDVGESQAPPSGTNASRLEATCLNMTGILTTEIFQYQVCQPAVNCSWSVLELRVCGSSIAATRPVPDDVHPYILDRCRKLLPDLTRGCTRSP